MYKRNLGGRRNVQGALNLQKSTPSASRNVDNLNASSVTNNDDKDINKLGLRSTQVTHVNVSQQSQITQNRHKSKPRKSLNYFEEVMTTSGLIFNDSEDRFTLSKDQALFLKELECELRSHLSYPKNLDEFISSFEKYISSSRNLRKALSQTKTSSRCTSASSMQQDSLVRLLLLTAELQPRILKIMIEKMAEFAFSSVDDMGDGEEDEVAWVRLILSQFRLLDFVVDGDSLANQLIEFMQVAPEPVQQEVIFFMPQIISDDKHQEAAESLSKMLHENFSLTPNILDVLSQLNIGSIMRAQVCEEMLDALRRSPLDFFPSIVAFVLSEAELSDLKQVTARLRLLLDLTPLPPKRSSRGNSLQNTQSGASKNSTASASKLSFEVLTLEAIAVRLKAGTQGQRLFDAWLTSLEAVKSAAEHRPLDILIIIILLDSVSGVLDGAKERACRRKVGALLKSKVRSSLFTEELLEKTFSLHPTAIQEYLKSVTSIASLLLSSRELILLNHGATWLRLSFVHLAEYLRPTILAEIIMHTAVGKVETVSAMLRTLHILSRDHYEKLAPRSALLMGLLEKVEDMEVEQVSQLMDVLCFLAFSKEEHGSRLRSDITILLRKHLSSYDTQLKRKGVISATMVVKHMASLESEHQGAIQGSSNQRGSSWSRDSQGSDDSLVPGSKAFNAMIYIEMVLTTCSCYPEVFGLLFDQLSCMAMDAELDEKFMEWLIKTMSLDLQNSFLVETSADFESYSNSFEDLPVTIIFGLDTDINNPIALNLTPLVAQREERLGGPRVSFGGKTTERAELPLEMLNPALRLMRILRFRIENGDLSSIDALLGCGVVLPKLLMNSNGNDESKIVDEFAALSSMEQKTFLSSLMYAINWFRELVNAFAFQKDQESRMKVIKRVMNIVELQEILVECLPHLPGYVPPPAHFLNSSAAPPFTSLGKNSSKGPKKRKQGSSKRSKKSVPLTGGMGTQEAEEEGEGSEGGGRKEQKTELILSASAPFFRELDMGIFGVLISEEFVVTPTKKSERPAELGPAELLFLLEDYTLKLEHALSSNPLVTISSFGTNNQGRAMPFSPSNKKKSGYIFHNLDAHETKTIVRSVISLLPFLCKKLEKISDYFRDTIESFDGILDNPQMFLGHSPDLARCLHLLLRDIGALLSWNGYASLGSQGTSLIKEVLTIIGGRQVSVEGCTQRTRAAMTIAQLAQESCSYVARFAEWIARLPTAVALVSLLHRTTVLADSHQNQREQLVSVCRMFLSREWIGVDGLPETGGGAAVNLGLLMSSLLWASCSEASGQGSPLAILHGIVEEVEKSAEDMNSTKDRLSAFPSITKSTFHVIYQALATWLAYVVREEEIEPRAIQREERMHSSQLLFSQPVASQTPSLDVKLDWWQIAVKCLFSLVKISKMQESRRNLSTLLKKSLLFINTFLSNGMPVFDKALCTHSNKVCGILRDLQNSTRYLQHLCCDCKVKGDVGLTAHVPPVKRSLEQLVFRVQDMLLKNNCAVAFWVGNLKNKNLRGEEIISQHISEDISLNSEEGSEDDNEENAESDNSSSPPQKKNRSKRKAVMDDDDDSEVGSDVD